ncbi:excinuclease ABC subunit B [Candidatus Peregrinibacteria bacterium RIFOXYB2_FULL_32_7]|nr:MAG: excinuclease ABC subunit B [Candidatus Peregrinibacteria bacterium RIFOXYB2_FULL_32_7]
MLNKNFELICPYQPAGDQPLAIEKLVKGFKNETKFQTLLGITGSGKTFTMANAIAQIQKPTLVLTHNKTLAAQLCSEFTEFFPNNAVSYFVSYYDYYQPEAYMASTDTYIEKDASINEEINKHRHAATMNLLTRKDVIVISSVSCIYGLGSVDDYAALAIELTVGETIMRDKLLRKLTEIQYRRSQMSFDSGMFHVLGDTLEIFPPGGETIFRIEFFGDEIERITEVEDFTGELIQEMESVKIFPAKHDVTTKEKIERSVAGIKKDLDIRYEEFIKSGRLVEAERIKTRTEYDIEILLETGYCNGIENYTRYLNGLKAGEPQATLLDYFPDDFLLMIDESHITVPQVGGMHNGNLSRKKNLIDYGFRLPSAYDNRPLKFEEFETHMKNVLFISATPGQYEFEHTKKENLIEQIIRPTGLIDPEVEVRPSENQIQDILAEIKNRIKMGDRTLITTLTKKDAEKLTDFLSNIGIKVRYLHSDIDTMERIEILRSLRLGEIDVVVGINLLREGLDLPEVSFIAILDADKQGFLRSTTSLIQTIGRAARNVNGHVVMYADKMTPAMISALDETSRRRAIQLAHNEKHGITPATIKKAIKDIAMGSKDPDKEKRRKKAQKLPKELMKEFIQKLEAEMEIAVINMEFEKAADLRDEIEELKMKL